MDIIFPVEYDIENQDSQSKGNAVKIMIATEKHLENDHDYLNWYKAIGYTEEDRDSSLGM